MFVQQQYKKDMTHAKKVHKMAFYVYLRSWDNPESTLSSIKCDLPKVQRLDEDYEVALVDLSYTKSWTTIPESNVYYTNYPADEIEDGERLTRYPFSIKIPAGNYSMIELCYLINNIIITSTSTNPELKGIYPEVRYDKQTNRFRVISGLD